MKKILLSVAFIAVGFSAHSQEDFGLKKGNVLLEGSIAYKTSDNKSEQTKSSHFNFTPQIGYFFSDKFAAGVYFDLNNQMNDDYSGPKNINKSNNFTVGFFGRYYFLELGQRFKFYGQANIGFANRKDTHENDVATFDTFKGSGVNVGADLGVHYFVTPKIAVNFAFANVIDYTTTKPSGGRAINDFNLNVNNFNNFFDTATFGLTFKF